MDCNRDDTEASIIRRLFSLFYESIILCAVAILATSLVVNILDRYDSDFFRTLFQAYLLVFAGIYFTFFWTISGQTLPMKTWKLKLVNSCGEKISFRQALLRYVFAIFSVSLTIGVFWALVDRNGRFLHDRLAGTKIIHIKTKF